MKTFVCQMCRHVAFNEAPVECPVCGSAIENFESDSEAIIMPVDPENLTEFEKKHVPQININSECGLHGEGCTGVNIRVGEIEHVREAEHFIHFIDLYLDRKYIARTFFTKRIHPVVDLHLSINPGMFSVIANCNVHGNWRAKVRLGEEND